MGGRPGQRVVSLNLKPKTRTATATAAARVATEGDWYAGRGEAILTSVKGATRANVALRVRGESSLLESERDIIQPPPRLPFAQSGNVIGFPDLFGEIDPLLSAAAGETVTVAPVLSIANPTLADFIPNANQPALTDLGAFRTVRPQTRNYDLNGSYSTRLAPWLTGTASLRLNRYTSESKRGLPSATFALSPTNPASPFSTDVALAYYGEDPMRTRFERDSGEANVTLDGTFGEWISNFNVRHAESEDETRIERQSTFGSIPLDDTTNPFATDLSATIPTQTDKATAHATTNLADLSFTGPVVKLPAGPLQATVEGRLSGNTLKSDNGFSPEQHFHRSEEAIRGAIDVPITSRENGFASPLGDLSLQGEYTHIHFSDAGGLDNYSAGLVWEPLAALRLNASIEQTERPATVQTLGNPVIVTSNVRVFDPIAGDTVDVTQITGGNPDLRPEKFKIQRASALVRLVPRLNLQLNAEYTYTNQRNYISALPEASAAVMFAFPDRYVRGLSGELITVDLRPVNFDAHREKRLRWGLSMRTRLDGGPSKAGGPSTAGHPQTLLQLTANHTVVFLDEIAIRPGLPNVDLLSGGAIGIAGGRVRHQVDGTASITSGGLGARLGVAWRGKSFLDSRINGTVDTLEFSPVLLVNLRAFTDGARIFGHNSWTRGLRLSLNAINLLNDRQEVRDSAGSTPLQYQPGYRDPIGRTIEFEIRKVF